MAVCASCDKHIVGKSIGLTCAGECKKAYHLKCANIVPEEAKIYTKCKDGVSWKCELCRKTGRNSIMIGNPEDDEDSSMMVNSGSDKTNSSQYNKILDILEKNNTELKEVKESNKELLNSVQYLSSKIDEYEEGMKKLVDVSQKVDKLINDNRALNKAVVTLEGRISDLEQYSRRENVEIQGLPEVRDENMNSIVISIGEAIGCKVEPEDISVCHRIISHQAENSQGQRHVRPKNVVVKFTTRRKKDEFMSFKKLRGKLSVTDIKYFKGKTDNLSSNLVYINEHLTLSNKLLFKTVRDRARQCNYKFVWVRDGKILVRKNENTRSLHIKTEIDLNKIAAN